MGKAIIKVTVELDKLVCNLVWGIHFFSDFALPISTRVNIGAHWGIWVDISKTAVSSPKRSYKLIVYSWNQRLMTLKVAGTSHAWSG